MKRKQNLLTLTLLVSALSLPTAVLSSSVFINQGSLFLSSGGTTFQDDQLGEFFPANPFAPDPVNNFGDGGFAVSFSSSLDANNIGSFSWSITNETGGQIDGAHLKGFLDADLGGVFTNYGETSGNQSSSYDSWEIDIPFFPWGDIVQNAETGLFDNSNSVDSPIFSDDVALGLGINIDDWMPNETLLATFLITDLMNSSAGVPSQPGLVQRDALSPDAFHLSASVENIGVIPIPGTGGLMLTGLASLLVARYRLNKRVRS